tara:strand:+ start:1562 stop:1723 length:162 start_codon:yes stop_codon:yes gene_type:complete
MKTINNDLATLPSLNNEKPVCYTWKPSKESIEAMERLEARKSLDKTDLDNFKL